MAELVAAPIAVALGPNDPSAGNAWIGAGITFATLAVGLLVHGIWAAATRGWGNAPRTH